MRTLLSILFISLLFATPATALCNATGLPTNLLIENARPFTGVHESFTIKAHYIYDNGTVINTPDTNVTITFVNASDDVETANMTFSGETYDVTVTSNEEEDTEWLVQAEDNLTECKTLGFTTKWRVPFYVNIEMYKTNVSSTSSNPEPYTNEFQYVVLLREDTIDEYDLFIEGFNKAVDKTGNFVFGSLGVQADSIGNHQDSNIYFWAKYDDGDARVKLYEPANYTILMMSNKRSALPSEFWEFERPTTGDTDFLGKVDVALPLYNATNTSETASLNNTVWMVGFTLWEANQWHIMGNIFIIIFLILVWLAIPLAIAGLAQRNRAFESSVEKGLLWYFSITTPLLIGFIFVIR